ncbi:MAG TPA: hypothetical protein VKA47_09840 [Solirubrobacterales bacterium]|nr:hypothetical protein [Solirubrobacterales bacterium]
MNWLDPPGRAPVDELEAAVAAAIDFRGMFQGDELKLARHIALDMATTSPGFSANLTLLAASSREQKDELVAKACNDLGLESPQDRRDRERFEAINRALPRPAPPVCAVCGESPRDSTGMPDANVRAARRWHCDEHRHLAKPGDLDAPLLPITPGMQLLPDPDELKREEQRDARIQREQASKREQRRLRAREEAEVQRVREERFAAEIFGGPS